MSASVAEPPVSRTSRAVSARWRKIFRALPFDVFRDVGDCWFDEAAADYVIDFICTRLRYMEGDLAGELIRLEDWQKAIFGAIFGWKRADGTRRFRNVWFYIPRKNTKTMMLALMVIVMLFLEDEGAQQLRSVAANTEQSAVLFGMVKGMIAQDDELMELCELFWSEASQKGTIKCGAHSFKQIAAGDKGKHGKNINGCFIDEVHEHKSAELIIAMRTSKVARRQPLFVEATTADVEGESYCNERHEYAKAVRDGLHSDPGFLPIIFELADLKRWKSEKAWKECNPNLGVSIKIEELRELCALAERMPSFRHEFIRLHLNGKVQSSNQWLELPDWDLCSGLEPGETPLAWRARMLEVLRGVPCWGGLDLGSVSDLTCEVLEFDGDDCGYPGAVVLLPWFWCPGDSIRRKTPEFQEYYQGWVDAGFLTATPGDVVDFETMRAQVIENHAAYPLNDLAIDYAWQGADTSNILTGHHGINVVAFPQGFNAYTPPMQDFEIRVKGRRVVHGGNPVLRWMAGNTVAAKDATGKLMRPVKESKNSAKKIDGIAAALMAHGRWLVRTQVEAGEMFFV